MRNAPTLAISVALLLAPATIATPAEADICPNWRYETDDIEITVTPELECADVELLGALDNCLEPRISVGNACGETLTIVAPETFRCDGQACTTVQDGASAEAWIPHSDYIHDVPQDVVLALDGEQFTATVSYVSVDKSPDSGGEGGCAMTGADGSDASWLLVALAMLVVSRKSRRFQT